MADSSLTPIDHLAAIFPAAPKTFMARRAALSPSAPVRAAPDAAFATGA